jgi:hypothetical protein
MFRKISGGFPKQLGVERGVRPSFLTVTVQLVLFGLFRLSRLSVGLISWFGELGLLRNRQISLHFSPKTHIHIKTKKKAGPFRPWL